MLAIFKREYKSYFTGIVGWLFIAATMAYYFLYFYAYNMLNGSPYVASAVDSVTFIFMITVPILTMRVLAEEKKAKTDQLLLTSPVSAGKMVVAKFLAMSAVHTIAVAIICVTPVFLNLFGTVPLKESYLAILGLWLYGLTCIAIGTFVSSITESQIISAILSFVFLFVGYMMTAIINMLPNQESTFTKVLSKILGVYNLTSPLDTFLNGKLDFISIVYYVSVMALFLYLATMVIQKRRYSFNKNNLKTIVASGLFTAIVVVLVVGANLGVKQIPDSYTSIDVTMDKIYTLTDTTKDFLKTVDKDVNIYVLTDEASANSLVVDTIENYRVENKHINITYIDQNTNPTFYEKYADEMPSQGSAIVECGDKFKLIKYSEFFTYEFDYGTYQQNANGLDAEGQITSAIAFVTSDTYPRIYQLIGHDEFTLTGQFEEAIEKINYELVKLTLLLEDEVPSDCELLIINAPQSDFSDEDTEKLIKYFNNGGKALIIGGYTDEELPNFNKILSGYELNFYNGLVVEGDENAYYYQPMYLIPLMKLEDITEDLLYKYVLAPYSAGIVHGGDIPDEIKFTDLLYTSNSAYLKSKISNDMTLEQEDGDKTGPFVIGVQVENLETGSEVVVYSSSTMFNTNADEMVSGHNCTLFKSTIAKLLSSDDNTGLIAVDVKKFTAGNVTAPIIMAITVMALGVWIIPIILVIIGLAIWLVRRKK